MRIGLLCLSLFALSTGAVDAEVTRIAELRIPGNLSDRSGLEGTLEDGVPLNQFGGISAIAWAGGNVYYLQPDRGPSDGAVPYPTRFHQVEIIFTEKGQIDCQLRETRLLTKGSGQPLIGAASAFKKGDDQPGRLDPEGMRWFQRAGREPVLAISDEYGPRVDLYDLSGKRIERLHVPGKFEIEHPSGNAIEEAQNNSSGRQPNSGFESLGVTPDGKTLFTMNQRPLTQDGIILEGRSTGLLNRILKIEIESEKTAEFVYPLETPDSVVSELLMIDSDRALVLERDGLAGPLAMQKAIYLIDMRGASDVSGMKSLPGSAADLPSGVHPVSKRMFVDLLSPSLGIAGVNLPAKFEGLTFGPDLSDGRKSLFVSVDNDFKGDQPTVIYVLAIPAESLK